ncbi:MAG: hypothetical protein JXX28_00475 [Deltaproteobacteria bacterium]|nr:hypothetical protein [Deltaproteobacteria bacterium]
MKVRDPSDLDELFGGGTGQAKASTGPVLGLLVAGVVLAVLGMACSAAPGGLLVLGAWLLLERDLDRVESGYLPVSLRPRLRSLQWAVYAGIGLVILLFFAQGLLFCGGFYDSLWANTLQAVVDLLVRAA